MPRYRVIGGAPWRRPSGDVVPPGGEFDVPEGTVELDRIRRRGHTAQLQAVDAAEQAVQNLHHVPPPPPPPPPPAGWTLRMQPVTYLKLHPQGPHAELARKLVQQSTQS